MTVPTHIVQVAGQGPTTADQLNTLIQTCTTLDDARGFIGVAGMQMYLQGYITPGDGGEGGFYWNPTGTAPDDGGITTIIPFGSVPGSGEWTRTRPIAISFAAELTTTGTTGPIIPVGTFAKVELDLVLYDTGGFWDPVNFRYLPRRAGKYQVNCGTQLINSATTAVPAGNYIACGLFLNGVVYRTDNTPSISNTPPATGLGAGNISALVPMNGVTDYIELFTLSSSASTSIGGSFMDAQLTTP